MAEGAVGSRSGERERGREAGAADFGAVSARDTRSALVGRFIILADRPIVRDANAYSGQVQSEAVAMD